MSKMPYLSMEESVTLILDLDPSQNVINCSLPKGLPLQNMYELFTAFPMIPALQFNIPLDQNWNRRFANNSSTKLEVTM